MWVISRQWAPSGEGEKENLPFKSPLLLEQLNNKNNKKCAGSKEKKEGSWCPCSWSTHSSLSELPNLKCVAQEPPTTRLLKEKFTTQKKIRYRSREAALKSGALPNQVKSVGMIRGAKKSQLEVVVEGGRQNRQQQHPISIKSAVAAAASPALHKKT